MSFFQSTGYLLPWLNLFLFYSCCNYKVTVLLILIHDNLLLVYRNATGLKFVSCKLFINLLALIFFKKLNCLPNWFDNNIPFPFETSVKISLSSSIQWRTI